MRGGFITKLFFPAVLMLCGSVVLTGAVPWYNSNWVCRHPITIRSTSVSGTLTNYPVLINISNSGLLLSNARSDGADILFTDAIGTNVMDFEIESYTNGTLHAWVRYPSLTSSAHSNLYIYYGNPDHSNSLAVKTNVWDTNYQLVVHCNDTNGNNLYDSSKYQRIGTNTGGGTPTFGEHKVVGPSVKMDGIFTNYWNFCAAPLSTLNWHLEFWHVASPISNSTAYGNYVCKSGYSAHTSGQYEGVVLRRYPQPSYDRTYMFYGYAPSGTPTYTSIVRYWTDTYRPFDSNIAYYYSFWMELTSSPSNYTLSSVLNGGMFASPSSSMNFRPKTDGNFSLSYTDPHFAAYYDELRVSSVARGSNYAATVYTNLAYPQNFIWVSNVEALLKTRFAVSTTNIHKHPALAGIAVYSNQTPIIANDITNAKYIFGDGSTVTRSGSGTSFIPVEYSLSGYGTYTNWLVTADTSGAVASNSLVVNVIPYAYSTARFTVHPHEALLGSRVLFTDDSIKEYNLTNWEIDFGDGKSYTVRGNVGRREISYAYSRAGIYTASLRVVDERGVTNTNTYTIPITITDRGAIQLTNMTRRVYNRALDFPMGFKYPLSGKAEKVYVRILSISGYMIRDLGVFNGFTDTEVFISWDGNNWKGQGVAAGLYYVRFDVIGEGERLSSETEFFILK